MTEEHDENLSKFESCMSMEHKEGWVAISILIDSGASDSVCPPGLFPEVPVYETSASRNGVEYTAAGGHNIANLGMCQPIIHTLEGDQKMFAFQVASVGKALGAVSRMTGSYNDVVFRHPDRGGSIFTMLKMTENILLGKQVVFIGLMFGLSLDMMSITRDKYRIFIGRKAS